MKWIPLTLLSLSMVYLVPATPRVQQEGEPFDKVQGELARLDRELAQMRERLMEALVLLPSTSGEIGAAKPNLVSPFGYTVTTQAGTTAAVPLGFPGAYYTSSTPQPDTWDNTVSFAIGFAFGEPGAILTYAGRLSSVDPGAEVEVRTVAGKTLKAKLAWKCPDTGLALLKVEGDTGLRPLKMNDAFRGALTILPVARKEGVGLDLTTAVGSHFTDQWLSPDGFILVAGGARAGAPILDAAGNVIAMALPTRDHPADGSDAVGLPASAIRRRMEFAASGKEPGRIGIHTGEEGEGVKIKKTEPGSPAQKADLRTGDVIIEVAGKPVRSNYDTRAMVRFRTGEEVPFRVRRGDKIMDLKIRVAADSELGQAAERDPFHKAGLEVMNLTAEMAEFMGLDGMDGVLVKRAEGAAAEAGLRKGDVIRKVDEQVIKNRDDLIDALGKLTGGTVSTLKVVRDGVETEILLRLARGGTEKGPAIEVYPPSPESPGLWPGMNGEGRATP